MEERGGSRVREQGKGRGYRGELSREEGGVRRLGGGCSEERAAEGGGRGRGSGITMKKQIKLLFLHSILKVPRNFRIEWDVGQGYSDEKFLRNSGLECL